MKNLYIVQLGEPDIYPHILGIYSSAEVAHKSVMSYLDIVYDFNPETDLILRDPVSATAVYRYEFPTWNMKVKMTRIETDIDFGVISEGGEDELPTEG